MMTVIQHTKNEWSRMAQAAYAIGRNDVGHRMSGAASIPAGTRLDTPVYDRLMNEYRAWLVFNQFALEPEYPDEMPCR